MCPPPPPPPTPVPPWVHHQSTWTKMQNFDPRGVCYIQSYKLRCYWTSHLVACSWTYIQEQHWIADDKVSTKGRHCQETCWILNVFLEAVSSSSRGPWRNLKEIALHYPSVELVLSTHLEASPRGLYPEWRCLLNNYIWSGHTKSCMMGRVGARGEKPESVNLLFFVSLAVFLLSSKTPLHMTDQRLSDSLPETHISICVANKPSSLFYPLRVLCIWHFLPDSPLQSLSFASFPVLFYTKYCWVYTQLC